jgi:hypothetical protein
LAPTRKIVGVEDPYLQSSAAPNYFADAWEAWLNLNGERGRSPDLGFALVVNSALARSQDQLHIHMGCLAPSARSALDAAAPRLAIGEWSPIGPLVPHQPFWAFRTGTADLGRLDPFRLAAEGFADKVRNLALLTVVVASARIAGADEFVVLASYAGAPHAWWPARALSLRAASLLVAIDRDDPILGTAARAPEAAPAPGPHVRATRRPEPSRLRRVRACAPPRLVRRALKSLPPTARDRLAVEERLACYEAANRLHNPRKPVSESAPRGSTP